MAILTKRWPNPARLPQPVHAFRKTGVYLTDENGKYVVPRVRARLERGLLRSTGRLEIRVNIVV
jgi:hypothetical protein